MKEEKTVLKSPLKRIALSILCIILLSSALSCNSTGTPSSSTPTTRVITDMMGRSVTIPARINRVLGTSPVETILAYMLAPDKVGAWTFQPNGTKPFLPAKYLELPIIGGWFGKQTGNFEEFIKQSPDIIFVSDAAKIEDFQKNFGTIPVVGVEPNLRVDNYAPFITFMGDVLGAEEQAAKLVKFYEEAKSYAAKKLSTIPEASRVRVYYAEGKEGLSTDPEGAARTLLLKVCGGVNVAPVPDKGGYGMFDVSLEQIIKWDPDVIIIGRGADAGLRDRIMSDVRWSGIKAVRNKRVYLRPDNPFSWYDGPAGINEVIGFYWMLQTFYPQFSDLDLRSKVKEFYADFYHYKLTDAELSSLLDATLK